MKASHNAALLLTALNGLGTEWRQPRLAIKRRSRAKERWKATRSAAYKRQRLARRKNRRKR